MCKFGCVALRKESVDRNHQYITPYTPAEESLSARRAWIEIWVQEFPKLYQAVALRKESVDRNFNAMKIVIVIVKSLSARRAWIEI